MLMELTPVCLVIFDTPLEQADGTEMHEKA